MAVGRVRYESFSPRRTVTVRTPGGTAAPQNHTPKEHVTLVLPSLKPFFILTDLFLRKFEVAHSYVRVSHTKARAGY